ncbi:hypothetical protein scyTo_0010395 [Scyliorhinus torazame]|uniref:Uncharacterized protein n=1 Tax=Scyliorhinus torazame TaxID=75743 RepID=A0A401P5H3_SCYTO|nr:hypothetical protein [Scyliorhinus torazame]
MSDSSPVFQPTLLRCRRSSASVNLSCPSSSFPLSPFRTFNSRIDQIRQEESMDVMNRETAHERLRLMFPRPSDVAAAPAQHELPLNRACDDGCNLSTGKQYAD